jgi:hypothetical protein
VIGLRAGSSAAVEATALFILASFVIDAIKMPANATH